MVAGLAGGGDRTHETSFCNACAGSVVSPMGHCYIPGNLIRARMSSAAAVTDASFEQDVLKSDVPVLVDFWAPWCGPCRMVAPIVDEIAKEFEGRVKVFKLNTDENPNVASQYGIRSIPTLMVFKGGQKVDTVVGAVPKNTLSGTISKYL